MRLILFSLYIIIGSTLIATESSPKTVFLQNRIIPEGIGVNIHFLDNRAGLDALCSLGARWLRMDITWNRVEYEKGKYDFSNVDKLMNGAKSRGLRVLGIIDYQNSFYEPAKKIVSEAGRQAYATYAAALAKRYADYEVIWEIWNEPNNGGFWPGNNPDEYMALLKTTVAAMRKANPKVVILGPSTYRVDPAYMEACFRQGLLDLVDAISFHPYRRFRPEELLDDIALLRELIRKYRKDNQKIPAIVCSEWGFSATQHNGEHGQALRVARAILLSHMVGIDLYIYYDLWNDGGDPSNSEHNYGLFTSPPLLIEKRAGLVFKTLTKTLHGFRFVRRIGEKENPHRFLLEFISSSGEKRYVHWSDDEKKHIWRIPAGFGMLNRVTMTGQQLAGIYQAGDNLTSQPEIEYLIPAESKPATWKTLAVLLPTVNVTGPWQTESSVKIQYGSRINTGMQDMRGAIDYWFKANKKDFGAVILQGGDLEKPFPTLEFRLDEKGRPFVRHWVWHGRKWLKSIGTNEAVQPGEWTRITYVCGKTGRRLYINGQPVASSPGETNDVPFAFHMAPRSLKGTVGQLRVITGDGFQL